VFQELRFALDDRTDETVHTVCTICKQIRTQCISASSTPSLSFRTKRSTQLIGIVQLHIGKQLYFLQ
jgi:hypothetical protein